MASIDQVRSALIHKLHNIQNKDFLLALDGLVSTKQFEQEVKELTKEQKLLLEMSEQDFEQGNIVTHEAIHEKVTQWLGIKES
jgi:hypothetical protein